MRGWGVSSGTREKYKYTKRGIFEDALSQQVTLWLSRQQVDVQSSQHGRDVVWTAANINPTHRARRRRWCVPLRRVARTVCGCWSMPAPTKMLRIVCVTFSASLLCLLFVSMVAVFALHSPLFWFSSSLIYLSGLIHHSYQCILRLICLLCISCFISFSVLVFFNRSFLLITPDIFLSDTYFVRSNESLHLTML